MKTIVVAISRNPKFLKSKAKHKPIERHSKSQEPVFIYEVSKAVVAEYVEKELIRNAYRYRSSAISTISNDPSNKPRKTVVYDFGTPLN
jgi:hypothetical protein